MSSTDARPGWVDRHPLAFVVALTLLLLLVVNLAARPFVKKPQQQSITEADLAAIHGSAEAARDYWIVAQEQAAGQEYQPFVEYREKAHAGKFVNVSAAGTRCHAPQPEACLPRGGKDEIWLFGGSTTFGYAVKDGETMAAHLDVALPQRVINFGTASYYSTIERIRFANLLTELEPPFAAVFVDGLNDFYYFGVPDRSTFSDVLAAASGPKPGVLLRLVEKWPIFRLMRQLRAQPPSAPIATEAELDRAIRRLRTNQALVRGMGAALGVKVVTVLQPVPTYGPGHATSRVPEHLLRFAEHRNSGEAYRRMFASGPTPLGEDVLYLQDLSLPGPMYVDTVHYSPAFNGALAARIADYLRRQFSQMKK